MQPREIFGIAVRIIGVICLLLGGWRLTVWLPYSLGYSHMLASGIRPQCIYFIVVGLAALRGAEQLTRFTYTQSDAQHSS